ncbi:MAG: aminopeptidase P family protein, partial [Proteobacteria bacterium]|nr:aminopeptidase P family protein [Pseudomonadota bacterium]
MTRPAPLPPSFYSDNRKVLIEKAGSDALVLIQSAEEMVRNSDILHSWRQDSNFFYFTGINYPGCSLLLVPEEDGKLETILFIPATDPEAEKWTGKMLSKEVAKEISGVKNVQTADTLAATLVRRQKWREFLYCEVNDQFPNQPLTAQHLFLENLARRLPGLCFKKLAFLTTPLRIRKRAEEIDCLKKSISIIEQALSSVMRKLRPGMMEYQVEAELVFHYLHNGCCRQGFEAIAAGGKNATVLHYVDNADELKDGDLILVDTGGEYGMYSGDITRIFPVNGRFSPRQRQCYQAVLDVNQAFTRELRPGRTWKQLYEKAGEIMGDIYAQHGFIDDPQKHLSVGFHRIGHFLGLDVHDVGRLDQPMESGTVVTVEPGLYLPDEGIGIRIEDNVLLTDDGAEVLSKAIPKETEEIEE